MVDIIRELQDYGVEVAVSDPRAEPLEAQHEYGITLLPWSALPRADALVAAVAHREFTCMSVQDLGQKLVRGGAFMDVKAAFEREAIAAAGYRLWRL